MTRLSFPVRAVRRTLPAVAGLLCAALLRPLASGAELEEARKHFTAGDYQQCAREAFEELSRNAGDEEWALLATQSLEAGGRMKEAREVVEKALGVSASSLRLRLLALRLARNTGDADRARELLAEITQMGVREWAYTRPADRVALGQAALLAGSDPKRVLDRYLDPVKKAQPDFRDAWLASGQLALDKSDFNLAAKIFTQAAKRFPEDPEIQLGLARAWRESDAEATAEALEKALAGNPNLVAARLMIADHAIDAEHYEAASEAVDLALKVNPSHPEAHAFRAVLAELKNDPKGFEEAHTAALRQWPTNPAVEHLIGRKFSQKYRFAEGAEYQRKALAFDPEYLPAKIQLAQDLLRLGNDEEGWKLAEEVQKADPYDVVAYNLVTLRDSIAHFQTLESEHFFVRMDPAEASVYGSRVLELLEKAHASLCQKYGLQPGQRTIVEIFPDQKDFAIRTFGLPGGAGYLGVCFGRLITANSPAAHPSSPINWESVLWHEFAHVVTLGLTRNRMPRWLSEGISVYEERQARGNWGEQMKPRYRAMIFSEDLTPVSQLSGAFLQPKSPAHLQFAYYESSLVVEYLLEQFGIEAMKGIFADLAAGAPINAALANHTGRTIEQIDEDFAERARALARATGPKLDWAKPQAADVASDDAFEKWVAEHPDNYTALMEKAGELLKAREWAAAKAPLKKLIELYPDQHESDSAYAMLARVHRELGESDEEFEVLKRFVELNAEAPEAHERLMTLYAQHGDWQAVLAHAEQFAAVNPLSPVPYRFEADAREALGKPEEAATAWQTLLRLNPPDPSRAHYRLARLLQQKGEAAAARRHVLQALENAPRFREALKMLAEMNEPAEAGEATQ